MRFVPAMMWVKPRDMSLAVTAWCRALGAICNECGRNGIETKNKNDARRHIDEHKSDTYIYTSIYNLQNK